MIAAHSEITRAVFHTATFPLITTDHKILLIADVKFPGRHIALAYVIRLIHSRRFRPACSSSATRYFVISLYNFAATLLEQLASVLRNQSANFPCINSTARQRRARFRL